MTDYFNNYFGAASDSTPANYSNYGGNNIPTIIITNPQTVNQYPVAANNTVMFIDFNAKKFYIKSTNQNGIQNRTREFDFVEKEPPIQNDARNSGVTREEFEAQQKKLEDLTKLLEDLTSPNK